MNASPIRLLGFLFLLSACREEPTAFVWTPLPNPAPAGSFTPSLFVDEAGLAYLTWQIPDGEAPGLYVATLNGERWDTPRLVAGAGRLLVNWADFPTLTAHRDGNVLAHHLASQPAGGYAYDIALSSSADHGATWSAPVLANTDGTPTEHGFVSMLPWERDRFFLTWLDGRRMVEGESGEMTLRAAFTDATGNIQEEMELDAQICTCCQTAAAWTGTSLVVAYRDRSDADVRDIYFTRFASGAWSTPMPIHRDEWVIAGCPVNGPDIDALGPIVATAWFTAADDRPAVKASVSMDDAVTFGDPVIIDAEGPIGRVAIQLLDDRSALVLWMARTPEAAALRARVIAWDGAGGVTAETPMTLAPISPERTSGFPRIARIGDAVLVAWTELDDAGVPTVRTSLLDR